MIHLVLPMAGRGSRFLSAGVMTPKPLIEVGGWPMFELVLANLWSPLISRITLVCLPDVANQVNSHRLSRKLNAEVSLKVLSEITNGPATTVALALAERESRPSMPLIVANTDQYLDTNVATLIQLFLDSGGHLIVGMEAHQDKWSFVKLDSITGKVGIVREKEPVSKFATCGIYMFSSEEEYLSGYTRMVEVGDFTLGELYVAPIYNYLEPNSTDYINLGEVAKVFYGLGTPEDFENFVSSPVRERAESQARAVLG